jgi:hypothetical protein
MAAGRLGRFLLGGAIWCVLSAPAAAATVTLAWDQNPEPNVNNYNVYVRTANGAFGAPIAVGNRTTWTFVGLQSNVQYFFAVQAQSSNGLSALSQIGYVIPAANPPGSEAARSDFNGDGWFDLLWQNHGTGQLVAWHLNGSQVVGSRWLTPSAVAPGWSLSGSGDFNKDGKPDVLWHNQQTGQVVFWLMDGALNYSSGFLPGPVSSAWKIASVRDLNADGNPDIWWHNQETGDMTVWYFNGSTYQTNLPAPGPSRIADTNWKLKGTADFDRDGRPDAVWHNETTGELRFWKLNGVNYWAVLPHNIGFVATDWKIAAVGDATGDGWPDILWQNYSTGGLVLWRMQGTTKISGDFLSIPAAALDWKVVGPK